MTIDFNKSPYNDDFQYRNNYIKTLFKAGFPVQTRELNTLQSTLQNQIGVFANHIFKNGSKVSNCRTSIVTRDYARLLDVYADTTDEVDVAQFDTTYRAIGEVSKVEAQFVKGTNKTITDPATIFIVYDKTGEYDDEEQVVFMGGEPVSIVDKNGVVVKRVQVRCPGCPNSNLPVEVSATGRSAFFAIDEGSIYYQSYFLHVPRQEIILIKYLEYKENGMVSNPDKFKIGLDFIESIVTASDDPTLYDNSLGYPNYAAEGADRYHAELVLVKRDYSAEDGDNFILLAKVLSGLQVEYMKADAEYGQINEEFARRTYEQAGDFTVSPYKTKFYEAKKTADNGAHGWSETGKDSQLVAVVSPAVSYVKGIRNETKVDTVVTFDKARDTEKVDNFSQYLPNRSYITVSPVSKNHIVSPNATPSILSTNELYLYDGDATASDVSGFNIGFVKVIDQSIVSNGKYRLFIYDVTITKQGATFGQAKSCKTADGKFVAKMDLNADGISNITDANNISLIFPINQNYIKSLRDVTNADNGDTTIFVRRKLVGRTDNLGRVTFNAQTNESFLVFNPQDNFAYIGTADAPDEMISLTPSNYVTTGATLTIDASPSAANKEIVIYANVQKVNQTENTKILDLKTFTTLQTPQGVTGEIIKLGIADAFQVKSIQVVKDGSQPIDVTEEYVLLNGQTDMYYTESTLKALTNRVFDTNAKLLISVYYFKHEGIAGFFTVDSYSQLINEENEWGLTYKDIPSYTTSNGNTYRLSDAFDFRPILMNNVINTNTVIPVQSTTVVFDVEFYLPRTDNLCINANGDLYVKKGTPSLNPVPPKPDDDAMTLYEIRLKAYTFNINDVSTKFIENKRYTMRDIGRIENRVEKLEYYQTLSLLEQKTANMQVKDQNGLDRYKNGFLVDSFTNYSGGDLLHPEFKATIDANRGELRPIAVATSTKLEVDYEKSVNIQRKGKMAIIPYDEEKFQENPYATRNISINPYLVYNKKGSLVLSPNIDTWSDTTRLPDVVTNIDTGLDAIKQIADASGVLGAKYGSWTSLNTTTQLTEHLTTETSLTGERNWMRFNNGMHWGLGQNNVTYSETTGTTTNTSQRQVDTVTMESRINEYTITDIVKDVSIQPYVRSRIVEFYGSRMKPNRTVYAYFDGKDVSQYCRMIDAIIYDDMEIEKMRKQSIYGGIPLKTDDKGEIRGEFRIPANTFFTGEKTFVLTDDPKNTGNNDTCTTSASASYFAGGINQSKQDSTLNVITPDFKTTSRTEERTITQTQTSREQTTTEVIKDISSGDIIKNETTVVEQAPPKTVVNQWKSWWNIDPVAQAFVVTESCFISRLDLYFREIDQTTNEVIWVELRTMQNGYPTTNVLARKEYRPEDVAPFASELSDTAFSVIFDMPVYVDANISYCFVVGGYSPDTRIWVSHLGEEVVNMKGKTVEEPPTPFSSFRSVNGETWNAEQYENIKHGLYRAVFKSRKMEVKIRNTVEQDALKLEDNPFEIQNGENRVRVYAPNHGVNILDRVSISLFDGIPILIEVGNTTPPQITQKISTPTGSGIVTDVQLTDEANKYIITLKNVYGKFELDQAYTGETRSRPFRDADLMASNGNSIPLEILINESLGKIKSIPNTTIGYDNIGGAGFELFNYEHVVVDVDSADTFIIEIAYPFTHTGRYGGKFGSAYDISRRYEMYNISGAYLPYNAVEKLTFSPIKQTQLHEIEKPLEFGINIDHYLPYSMKMLSNKNEVRVFGSQRRSADITLTFESQSSYLSPVINTDSFSMITVSNRVDNHDATKLNVLPNKTDRYISETKNGNCIYKYVTKKVLMKNSAQELKIFVDVYKDINADFDIYVKPIEVHETKDEANVDWILIDKLDKTLSSNGVSDYIEYEITASEDATLWRTGLEYIAYRVKIVGRTTNAAKPPMFDNLRTIAVT